MRRARVCYPNVESGVIDGCHRQVSSTKEQDDKKEPRLIGPGREERKKGFSYRVLQQCCCINPGQLLLVQLYNLVILGKVGELSESLPKIWGSKEEFPTFGRGVALRKLIASCTSHGSGEPLKRGCLSL